MTGADRRLSAAEFVALIAMVVATVAFSIDAMLPGLGDIAAELTPEAPNRAQLVLTIFMLGMGIGTLFVGSLADAFGRRPVIFAGALAYGTAAALGWSAASLEGLLVARFFQGLAAAAPRVVAIALIRDLYAGRQMAKMLSLTMMVFALFPVLAPAMGAGLIAAFGWRSVFLAFIVFSAISSFWFWLRQAETLPPEARRPLSGAAFAGGIAEVFAERRSALSIAAQCFMFGNLFVMISTTQPVFDQSFDRAASFPYWFGMVALIAASGSFINSRLVERFGMRRMVIVPTIGLIAVAAPFVAAMVFGLSESGLYFPAYMVLMVAVFFNISFTMGNINALAMEPLGHLAGLAASVIGAVSTVAGALLGMLGGALFDGTPLVPAILVTLYACAILLIVRAIPDA